MKGQRSASYPSYTVDYCLEFTSKIYKAYGNSYRARREDIAEALNLGVGTLSQKISASVQYGFLDLKSKEGYKVTDLFVECYRPINEDDKKESLINAFKNPSLYSTLIESFGNNILPPTKPLANILLHKHNISMKACDSAASIFEENIQNLGLINKERHFSLTNESANLEDDLDEDFEEGNYDSVNQNDTVEQNFPAVQANIQTKSNTKSEIKINNNAIPHNIPLKNKLPAQLLLPSDVSSADFDFIISYIGLIRNQY